MSHNRNHLVNTLPQSDLVVGIDLGTTNSVCAVFRNGSIQTISPVYSSDKGTPSVVHFKSNGERLVGHQAEKARYIDDQSMRNTISGAKYLIGRSLDEIETSKEMSLLNIYIAHNGNNNNNNNNNNNTGDDDDDKNVVIMPQHVEVYRGNGGLPLYNVPNSIRNPQYAKFKGKLPPQIISAAVLSDIRLSVQRQENAEVKKCVISVPTYFNTQQREATRQAAQIAGWEVLRIINEASSAGYSWAYTESLLNQKDNNNNNQQQQQIDNKKNIMVLDLGGGTFDVSILNVEKKKKANANNNNIGEYNNIDNGEATDCFTILNTDGDNHLGGDIIDNELFHYILNWLKKYYNIDLSKDSNNNDNNNIMIKQNALHALRLLRKEIEPFKKAFATEYEVELKIQNFYKTNINPSTVNINNDQQQNQQNGTTTTTTNGNDDDNVIDNTWDNMFAFDGGDNNDDDDDDNGIELFNNNNIDNNNNIPDTNGLYNYNLNFKMSRATFNNIICGDFVDKILYYIKKSLDDINMLINDIDIVLLVGGSTRLIAVESSIRSFFMNSITIDNNNNKQQSKKQPKVITTPLVDEIVAHGAALLAGSLSILPSQHPNNLRLVDITPKDLGIETIDGSIGVVIPKGTPLPCKIERYFCNGERTDRVYQPIYEGNNLKKANSKENTLLGELQMIFNKVYNPNEALITTDFNIDESGILSITSIDNQNINNTITTRIDYKASLLNNNNNNGMQQDNINNLINDTYYYENILPRKKDIMQRLSILSRIIKSGLHIIISSNNNINIEEESSSSSTTLLSKLLQLSSFKTFDINNLTQNEQDIIINIIKSYNNITIWVKQNKDKLLESNGGIDISIILQQYQQLNKYQINSQYKKLWDLIKLEAITCDKALKQVLSEQQQKDNCQQQYQYNNNDDEEEKDYYHSSSSSTTTTTTRQHIMKLASGPEQSSSTLTQQEQPPEYNDAIGL